MTKRRGADVFSVALACAAPSIAHAAEPFDSTSDSPDDPVAVANEANRVVSVWYRSSADCPDAATFVEKVTKRGSNARIAGVGDPVDFVVTLGTSNGTSSGRLERQTSRGTIAIRELSAGSCAEVADALALSLSLVDVERTETGTLSLTTESASAPDAPLHATTDPKRAPPVIDVPRLPSTKQAESPAWTLGAQGLLRTDLAPTAGFGIASFGSYDKARTTFPRPGIRLSASFARADGKTEAGDFRVTLVVGRVEGCPIGVGAFPIELEACAALELGPAWLEGSEKGGRSETRVWSGALGIGRIRSSIGRFEVEGEVGATLPFTRYRLLFEGEQGSSSAYSTPALGFHAALGAGFRLP